MAQGLVGQASMAPGEKTAQSLEVILQQVKGMSDDLDIFEKRLSLVLRQPSPALHPPMNEREAQVAGAPVHDGIRLLAVAVQELRDKMNQLQMRVDL